MLKLDLIYLRRQRPPPVRSKNHPNLCFFFPRVDGVGAGGSLDMAARLALPCFFLYDMLSWLGPSPQPCVEQNFADGPVIQLPRIDDCS